ncbi:hypothetical protein OWS73_06590 [Burkholderia sp. 1B3(2022)]
MQAPAAGRGQRRHAGIGAGATRIDRGLRRARGRFARARRNLGRQVREARNAIGEHAQRIDRAVEARRLVEELRQRRFRRELDRLARKPEFVLDDDVVTARHRAVVAVRELAEQLPRTRGIDLRAALDLVQETGAPREQRQACGKDDERTTEDAHQLAPLGTTRMTRLRWYKTTWIGTCEPASALVT